jgi:hypothetical protein
MQTSSQAKKVILLAGSYKPKKENVKKLKVYLKKIENES